MGERDALGPAGRARRVEDDGEVAVVAIDGRERLRLSGDDLVPGEPSRAAADQHDGARPALDLAEELGRGHDDLGLGIGQDVPDLVRSEQEHDGDDDAPRLEDAGVGLQHLGAVGQEHDHAIADLEHRAPQGVGEAVGHALLLDVGPLATLEGERDVFAAGLQAVFAEAGQIHGPRSYMIRSVAMLGGRLAVKISVLIVVVLIIGFGASTILTVQRESELLVEQNKVAARRLTATLVASIEGAMLQERPDVTRTVLQELKTSTPVEGLTIFRRNGVEAFTDLTTAMEVDKNAGLAKEVLANIKKMARTPGQAASGPLFARAAASR